MKKIKLTQQKFALVDSEDFEFLSQFKWCVSKYRKKYRAVTSLPRVNGKNPKILMHNLIMQRKFIDHIDGNPLNNQRKNLRPATHTQNACNRGVKVNNKCGLKGVYYSTEESRKKRWVAEVKLGDVRWRRRFLTKTEAYEWYKQKAKYLHKEFAKF